MKSGFPQLIGLSWASADRSPPLLESPACSFCRISARHEKLAAHPTHAVEKTLPYFIARYYFSHMKTVTINVPEAVYVDFQAFAKRVGRPTSELIRDAMELYRHTHFQPRTTLRNRQPASVGGPIQPLSANDDLLGEML
jgi:hypothetical protein